MTREQRRELVARLWRDLGWSKSRIAMLLGVDERTVRRDLAGSANAEAEPESTPTYVIGQDKKRYPARRRPKTPPSVFTTSKREAEAVAKAQSPNSGRHQSQYWD